jgi:hypothetical protein
MLFLYLRVSIILLKNECMCYGIEKNLLVGIAHQSQYVTSLQVTEHDWM